MQKMRERGEDGRRTVRRRGRPQRVNATEENGRDRMR